MMTPRGVLLLLASGLLTAAAVLGATAGAAEQAAAQGTPVAAEAFWVGGAGAPLYVERLEPSAGASQPYPLVLVHGAGQTGAATWLVTPDGREGWAPYFVGRGFTTYVVDLPGHGRSGQPPGFAQWSGLRYVEALEALLARTGPALVVTHSMGGRVGWKLAERAPDRLAGLFAVTPAPPPNLVPPGADPLPEDAPYYQPEEFRRASLGNTPTFPLEAWDRFVASLVPESARAVNEGRNAAGPELNVGPDALRGIRAVALAADLDAADPPAIVRRTADYFGIPFLQTDADWGLPGHGHMLMLERGNLDLATRVADWLELVAAGLGAASCAPT
ncbi:MAG TPA: alpha/beta hydrolase [Chloroflexota bacterium]|jgi:pimeloyl-ACP methyl ester carboxylesterase